MALMRKQSEVLPNRQFVQGDKVSMDFFSRHRVSVHPKVIPKDVFSNRNRQMDNFRHKVLRC